MAIPAVERQPLLTWEEYLAEPECVLRYDILDGERIVTNPTRRHQRLIRRLDRLFEPYERRIGGQVVQAPCDVLIRKRPLRTRQPDLLLIGPQRLARNPPETSAEPLSPAPELVVEILSPNESARSRDAKLRDYCSVDVREAWIVDPQAETVELLRLGVDGIESAGLHRRGETVRSEVFPGLEVPVDRIFEA